jgi:hypothetical protein
MRKPAPLLLPTVRLLPLLVLLLQPRPSLLSAAAPARSPVGRWPSGPVAPRSVSRWLAQLDAKVSCVVPGATESEVEVQDWLAQLGLLDFWQPLRALGVTSFDDLEFVEPEDMLSMGMKPVQRRKFGAAVDKLLRPPLGPGDDAASSSPSASAAASYHQHHALSVGSFPYAVPPHLHPKWGETKDLVVDKMMSTPLGKLRAFFEAEAGTGSSDDSSRSSSSSSSGNGSSGNSRTSSRSPQQQQSQPLHGAGKSEIADEATSLLASMEEMGEALDALGLDAWSMSIEELMALQDLVLEESGLRGPDLDTPTQRAISAFRAGDIIESQRLFELAGLEGQQSGATTNGQQGDDNAGREQGLDNSDDGTGIMRRARTDDESTSHSGTGQEGESHDNTEDERHAETLDALFQSGMSALETGDLTAAAGSFSAVLRLDPSHGHATHNLGVARAQASSLAYIEQHAIAQGTSLGGVMNAALENAIQLLGALASVPSPGQQTPADNWLFLELGVFEGHSLRRIARTMDRYDQVVHGFDSWQGLPEPYAGITPVGAFSTRGELPRDLPRNVELHSGWLNTSMPAFVQQKQQQQTTSPLSKVAFVHVDVDLYSSTMDGLGPLARAGMLVPGTVVLFDEFFGWPGWDAAGAGEAAAWRDICAEHGIAWRHVLAYKQRMVVEVVE